MRSTRYRRQKGYSKAVRVEEPTPRWLEVCSVKILPHLAPMKFWATIYFLGWIWLLAKVSGL